MFQRLCRNTKVVRFGRVDFNATKLPDDWVKWQDSGFVSDALFHKLCPGAKYETERTTQLLDILEKYKKIVRVDGGIIVPLMLHSYRMHKSWAVLTPLSEYQWDRGDGKVACFYENGVQEQFFNDNISDIRTRLCQ